VSKRLVYNGVHRYPDAPYPHIVCSYGTAIVAGLRQRGHDIEQWNFWSTDDRQTPTADAYDGVIINEVSHLDLWRRVVPAWDWANKFSLFWCHGVSLQQRAQLRFANTHTTRVAATGPDVLAAYTRLCGDRSAPFLLRMLPLWDCWAETPTASPYADGPAYLWAGRVTWRAVEALLALTEILPADRFHLIHDDVNDAAWMRRSGELKPAAVELLRRGVHSYSAKSHGTFNEYYWHAAVGLDVLTALAQPAAYVAMNCKVIDYVSAGLPIVSEWQAPGNWLYADRDWCRQVFPGDWESYAAAIVELSEQVQNRPANQHEIRQRFDFEDSLDVLSGELRQHGF